MPKLITPAGCRSLSILDLGAGDGSLGKAVRQWAAGRGWEWRVVNLDTSLSALSLNPQGMNVAGSAIQLPFRSCSFDVVIASQMVHHLSDPDVKRLLQEAWRVTRQVLLVCDLHRNLGLYLLLQLLFLFQSHPAAFKADGLLSVKRGWRVGELARLASDAGIVGANVKLYFGARVILRARKQPDTVPSIHPMRASVGAA